MKIFFYSRTWRIQLYKIFISSPMERRKIQLLTKLYLDLCDGIDLINSALTFQLVFIVLSSLASIFMNKFLFFLILTFPNQLMNIFSAFAIIRELLRPTENVFITLLPHALLISYQFFVKSLLVHSGSSTTKEAARSSIIIGRIMNEQDADVAELKTFLTQIRIRNLDLQNVFFKINWNILLAVGLTFKSVK